MNIGDNFLSVNVLIRYTDVVYCEHRFLQISVAGKKGCIIALPFFTYNSKQEQNFEGYLVYHDKDNYGFSKDELYKFGIEAIINASLSGMAGKLSPLPYKPIHEDKIEESLHEILHKNTYVDFSERLFI